jgi:hypothetical protein
VEKKKLLIFIHLKFLMETGLSNFIYFNGFFWYLVNLMLKKKRRKKSWTFFLFRQFFQPMSRLLLKIMNSHFSFLLLFFDDFLCWEFFAKNKLGFNENFWMVWKIVEILLDLVKILDFDTKDFLICNHFYQSFFTSLFINL